jgi:hypothetical protein
VRRVVADPELQGRLLGASQRAGDLARAAEERVELRGDLLFKRGSREYGRNVDSDFTGRGVFS